MWYPFYRDEIGRPVKGQRIDDRELARRAATKLQNELDESRREAKGPDRRTFAEWSGEFLEILTVRNRRESTRRAYVSTIKIAQQAFGHTQIRDVGFPDLRRFVTLAREGGAGDATISKHLRHCGAIFEAAVDDGVIQSNPVPRFRKGLGLVVPRGTTPFTDAELGKLFARLAAEEKTEEESEAKKPGPTRKPVYATLCRAALVTGARQGELIAATWGDLDLGRGILHISKSRDPRDGTIGGTKDHDPRDVYLIPQARKLFEDWTEHVGVRPDDEPIFAARGGSYVNGIYLTKLLRAAMVKAGVPTEDASGRPRKPFHGFRATFTRLCLESGRKPQWVQGQLGHSSESLTIGIYGEWSAEAIAAEASEGGAFPDLP